MKQKQNKFCATLKIFQEDDQFYCLTVTFVLLIHINFLGNHYGLGIESDKISEGVPSLEFTEKARFGALRCLNMDGSKFGCLLACLLKQINTLDIQTKHQEQKVFRREYYSLSSCLCCELGSRNDGDRMNSSIDANVDIKY